MHAQDYPSNNRRVKCCQCNTLAFSLEPGGAGFLTLVSSTADTRLDTYKCMQKQHHKVWGAPRPPRLGAVASQIPRIWGAAAPQPGGRGPSKIRRGVWGAQPPRVHAHVQDSWSLSTPPSHCLVSQRRCSLQRRPNEGFRCIVFPRAAFPKGLFDDKRPL